MNEKAVEVAKDVLKHLKTLNLELGYYSWIVGSTPGRRANVVLRCKPDDPDLQLFFDEVQKSCQVCILGSCVLSKARLYNRVSLEQFLNLGSDRSSVLYLLSDVFDTDTINLMESAFEGKYFPWFRGTSSKQIEEAIEFGRQYPDLVNRVKAVMENIIDNDGKFFIPCAVDDWWQSDLC